MHISNKTADYYSLLDVPIAKAMWDLTVKTQKNGWDNIVWRVAKFAMLIIPTLVLSVIDATILNLLRYTLGNLYLFVRGSKTETTRWYTKVYHVIKNHGELLGAAALGLFLAELIRRIGPEGWNTWYSITALPLAAVAAYDLHAHQKKG